MSIQTDLYVLLPELILAVGAMALLLVGAVRGDRSAGELTILSVILIAASAYVTMVTGDGSAFHGAFVMDSFARFTKAVILWSSAACVLMAHRFFSLEKSERFELPVLIVLASLGMSLMVSANNFIALYMGLELQSLALYVLAAFNRDSVRSSEAGLKYFVLGSLSSGMMLYGISMIYGFTGTLDFMGVAHVIGQSGVSLGLVFGLVFIFAGLAFKISAVPFHMWTPDVYEGAPTPVTAFFAAAPKLAAMALTVRVLITAFPAVTIQWQQIVVFLAIASMALGAFAAIGQTNIKRLMAYSSIGHMGYALVGLASGTIEGAQGVLVYLAIYVAMTLGSFSIILAMKRNGQAVEQIRDFAGLSRTNPALAGFFAKWYVFVAAIKANLFTLAVIGVLSSVVGAFYYLSIIKVMYFDESAGQLDPVRNELRAV